MATADQSWWQRNRCFFDCETGGLDPELYDLVEIAYIVTDPTAETVLLERTTRVKPDRPGAVNPRAAALNGYSESAWASAPTTRSAMQQFALDTKGCVIYAHNMSFDWAFVQAAMRRHGIEFQGDYHHLCTASLAEPFARYRNLDGVRLAHLIPAFGSTQHAAHTALSDARDCRLAYRTLMRIYQRGLELVDAEGGLEA